MKNCGVILRSLLRWDAVLSPCSVQNKNHFNDLRMGKGCEWELFLRTMMIYTFCLANEYKEWGMKTLSSHLCSILLNMFVKIIAFIAPILLELNNKWSRKFVSYLLHCFSDVFFSLLEVLLLEIFFFFSHFYCFLFLHQLSETFCLYLVYSFECQFTKWFNMFHLVIEQFIRQIIHFSF